MSDVLAIVHEPETDEDLLAELARRRPTRVTVLAQDAETDLPVGERDFVRDRLARLLEAIERRSGGVVVGLASSREQLRGWRFDRVIGARTPAAV